MSDSQILVSRELLRNVKREVDDLRDERDALLEALREAEQARTASADGAPGAGALDDDAADVAALQAQLDRAVERTVRAAEELTALRTDLAAARAALAEAQAEAAAAQAEADTLRRTHPMPPPPRRPTAPPAAGATAGTDVSGPAGDTGTGPAGVAGRAFAAWCRRNRALVSRPYLFASFLKTAAEGMEVEVTPVYRDRAASEPTFRNEAIDGVEHWLVRVGPATVLLPQPLSHAQFRELAPAFEGEATPETVGTVVPAEVAFEGGAHVLVAPGRVTADA